MQRTSPTPGDHGFATSASLATPQSTSHYVPGGPLAPGQSLAPSAAARTWPTILELFHAMKRRLVLATFLGLLVGMAAAAAIWLAMPNGKHRAQALLQIKPANTRGVFQNAGSGDEFNMFRRREENLVKGRSLLERVVADPRVAKYPEIKSTDDPVRFVFESIKIDFPAEDLMSVSMRGDNAAGIRETVATLIELYLKDTKSSEFRENARGRLQLDKNLENIDKRIKVCEDRLRKQAELGGGPNEASNVELLKSETAHQASLDRDLRDDQKAIDELTIKMQLRDRALKEMDKAEVTSEDLEKALERNEEIKEKVAKRNAQVKLVDNYELKSVPGASIVKESKETLKLLQADLDAGMNRLKPTVEKDIRAAMKRSLLFANENSQQELDFRKSMLKITQDKLAVTAGNIKKLGRAGHEIAIDLDDVKPLKEARTMLEKQILGSESLEAAETRVELREPAVVTLNQNLTQKVFLSVVAFFAGCLVVMLAVAFLEWRSRRVDSVEQVVNDLGLRVIGTIPAFPSKQSLKNGDAAQSQNWRFVLNESVNSARTMLLHTAKAQNMQILMVTSAMQGEGKTSLASQLATSMATAGLRTLILDCDLRNPSMHKLFDAPLTPGCAEVLCQEIDVSDAVQPTSVPNLWLIPAGQCSNRVITALAQGHPLETLFNRLRGQFDFIVVDSCPVLPVADSLLVGQHVDGVVLSILQDISQLPKVMTTAERLTQLNIPLLGAVVNGIKPDIHAYGYNYVKQLPA